MKAGQTIFIYLFIYVIFIIIESYRLCAKVKGYLVNALKAYKACRE